MPNRIVKRWSNIPAGRPVRPAGFALALCLSMFAAQPAVAASTAAQDVETARPIRPMWFVPGDDRAAYALIDQLDSSRLDGLDPRRFNTRSLIRAVRDAERGDPRAM